MSSVLAGPGVAAPPGGARGKRILVAGAVAFGAVLAFWLMHALIHPEYYTLYPVDLDVYRDGGLIARRMPPTYDPSLAYPLYDWPSSNTALSFTYTPFAALFFAVVSCVPWSVLPKLSVVINIVALVAALWFTAGVLGYRDRVRVGVTLLGSAAVFGTEPVLRTLFLGQVNLVLMALIIWDLCQPDTARSRWWKGAATGVAAGIKLVPLVFIPYLLLTRRFREAVMAAVGFVATVGLGFAILPGDSSDWWFHALFVQDGRTGFVGWGGNQSLRGIMTRLAGSIGEATVPWLLVAALTVAAGLVCAAMLDRAGHPVPGLLLTALTGLLASPVSWDHHWVWIAPGVVVAGHYAVRAWHDGAIRRAWACAALGIGMLAVFAPWPGELWGHGSRGPGDFELGLIWAGPNSPVTEYLANGDRAHFLEYHWHSVQLIAGNAYVLSGLALFAVLALTALRLGGGRAGLRAVLVRARRSRGGGEPGAATARTCGGAAAPRGARC